MSIATATVKKHSDFGGGYRLLELDVPSIAAEVVPGQFIHLKVPNLDGRILRRPFSIFKADSRSLSVLYKQVGRGTLAMGRIDCGDKLSIIGPLGNGFPALSAESQPVLVGGGYGVAPLYLLASRLPQKGILFVGGRTATDILGVGLFRNLGWQGEIDTEEGSLAAKGYVTDPLDKWLDQQSEANAPEFFVCGPDGLLHAIGERAVKGGWQAWLSLDKHMGCGVGACLACVQKIRLDDGSEVLKRVCKDGPVFESREIVWEGE
jgi:dihydroorotate dehydrogenase electron transfer subunit